MQTADALAVRDVSLVVAPVTTSAVPVGNKVPLELRNAGAEPVTLLSVGSQRTLHLRLNAGQQVTVLVDLGPCPEAGQVSAPAELAVRVRTEQQRETDVAVDTRGSAFAASSFELQQALCGTVPAGNAPVAVLDGEILQAGVLTATMVLANPTGEALKVVGVQAGPGFSVRADLPVVIAGQHHRRLRWQVVVSRCASRRELDDSPSNVSSLAFGDVALTFGSPPRTRQVNVLPVGLDLTALIDEAC